MIKNQVASQWRLAADSVLKNGFDIFLASVKDKLCRSMYEK